MLGLIKYILKTQLKLKPSKLPQQSSGFTLIELLVGVILTFLVITPLLGFMVNIMDTDRKEQAKANSQQEIQSALDYIAQDLKQAIYIYDANALSRDSDPTAPVLPDGTIASGIRDQIPPVAPARDCDAPEKCAPVLVFWKRRFVPEIFPNAASTNDASTNDDRFVYSLVAYYLIKDDTASPPWSKTARIARFEIKDQVPNPDDVNNPYLRVDPGFKAFALSGAGTLEQKMNRWQKGTDPFDTQAIVLIDYVDQNTQGTPPLTNLNCQVALGNTSRDNTQLLVSPEAQLGGINSFYACVDSSKNLARIYLRGNALARIKKNDNYATNPSAYFPSANVLVQTRGFLNAD
jgi:type II secretory pathway pseudopilin PulG